MQRATDGKANPGHKKSRHLGIQLNRKMRCRQCCVWMEVLEEGELPKKRLQNCRPYNNSKLCVLYKVLSRTPLSLYKKSGHKRGRAGTRDIQAGNRDVRVPLKSGLMATLVSCE